MAFSVVGSLQNFLALGSGPGMTMTRTIAAGSGAFIYVNYQNGGGALTIASIVNQASTNIPFAVCAGATWNLGAAVGYGATLLWVPSFPAGTTAVTVTLSGNSFSSNPSFELLEVAGLSTSITPDAQSGNTQTSSSTATDQLTSGSATPTGAATGAIVVGTSINYSAFSSPPAGSLFGANYVALTATGNSALEWMRITSNASVSANFTPAAASQTYGTQMFVIDEIFVAPNAATIAWCV